MLLEACVAAHSCATAAERAGADRIELNDDLACGGLTPSRELLQRVRRDVSIPIIAMCRPRAGDFVYDDHEFAVTVDAAESALAMGADGIAFGFVDAERAVDIARTRKLIGFAANRQTVFHRAFDELADASEALECLIDLGVDRVLTSGQALTAMEGVDALKRLIDQADGRIGILPAAGIKPANVLEIVARTGCTQVHGTFGKMQDNAMRLSTQTVADMRRILDGR